MPASARQASLITLLALASNIVSASAIMAQGDAKLKYYALVVGYTEYRQSRDKLQNPANDVGLLQSTFQSLDFDVSALINLTSNYYKESIRGFANRVAADKGPKIVAVYVAGHGVEIGSKNYIVPPDARPWLSERDAAREGLDVAELIKKVASAKADASVFFFDICRSNPFGTDANIAKAGLGGMSARRFVPVGPKRQANIIISFATQPGGVAGDKGGDNYRNSPYAAALAALLQGYSLSVDALLHELEARVSVVTEGSQVPWSDSAYPERIILGRHR